MTPPDTTTQAPPGVLLVADVARIWTEEARKQHAARVDKRAAENARRRLRRLKRLPAVKPFKEITTETVLAYRKESQPMVGQKPGRYAANPMPAPAGHLGTSRQIWWWPAGDEQALRDWWNSRPGQAHGKGGWPAGRPRSAT